MKLLGWYLRDRLGFFLLLGSFAVVFVMVFFLADVNIAALGYAGVLCLALVLLATVIDFSRYVRKHKELAGLQASALSASSDLPEAHDLATQDYQTLIIGLIKEKQQLTAQLQQREKESLDYYTLWAHQIKSPIAAMRLLLQGNETDADALAAELFRVERYVDMVLRYQHLGEFGDLLIRSCSLENMARQSVRTYAAQFVQKKLTLDFGELSGDVLTDEKWFCFVLEQLLSNAIKYTPGGGTVRIMQPMPHTLTIEDTGIGIAPEDLPRVCEKSFTGANGRMDKRATGIGLYLCKEICGKLGHDLRLDSVVGKGTTVTLTFDKAKLSIE